MQLRRRRTARGVSDEPRRERRNPGGRSQPASHPRRKRPAPITPRRAAARPTPASSRPVRRSSCPASPWCCPGSSTTVPPCRRLPAAQGPRSPVGGGPAARPRPGRRARDPGGRGQRVCTFRVVVGWRGESCTRARRRRGASAFSSHSGEDAECTFLNHFD